MEKSIKYLKSLSVFLDEEGMELFLDVLHAFPNEPAIETKVLALLNNIASSGEWSLTGFTLRREEVVAYRSVLVYLHNTRYVSFHVA